MLTPELNDLLDRTEKSQIAYDQVNKRISEIYFIVANFIVCCTCVSFYVDWYLIFFSLCSISFIKLLNFERLKKRVEFYQLKQLLNLLDETYIAALYLGDLSTMQIAYFNSMRSRFENYNNKSGMSI